jgi:hypothetical protein
VSDFAPLLAGSFRANAAYELVLFDRLAPEERETLDGLRSDPGFYGVLRPRPGAAALGTKSVDRETALLVLTLATAAPLPGYVGELFGADTGRAVARLVADGILEVDAGSGFVSGVGALELLATGAAGRTGGRIAALSREALRFVQALPIDEPLALAARLYGYNRLPLTPRWRRLLPDGTAHARYLGIATGGPAAPPLGRDWTALPPTPTWLSWRRRSHRRPAAPGGPTYKLYISPTPESLSGEGFATLVAALTAAQAMQFKVGADASGLLRPDKIVCYFPDFSTLGEAAALLRERLDGVPAHGVPFTAEIGADGLLSWGVDPLPADGLPWTGAESWRLWIAQRLARALVSARAAATAATAATADNAGAGGPAPSATAEPWRFAVERLRLEGIDTDTWTPGARIFGEA